MGFIHALRISILPRSLYLFKTLLVPVTLSFLHMAFTNFIWHFKTHNIAGSMLSTLKMGWGVLGTPELIKYYPATNLSQIVSWSTLHASNCGTEIETSQVHPKHPNSLIWTTSVHTLGEVKQSFLSPMIFTLSIWKQRLQKNSLTSSCSPLTNFLYNTELSDSLCKDQMLTWAQAKIFLINTFLT